MGNQQRDKKFQGHRNTYETAYICGERERDDVLGEISVLPLLDVIVVAATIAGLGFVLGGHIRVPCLLVGDLEKRVKAGKIKEDLSGTKGCFFEYF